MIDVDVGVEKRDLYLRRLNAFYDQVEGWCPDHGYRIARDLEILNEEGIGQYEAPAMVIASTDINEKFVVRLNPIGAVILGSPGRVDLKGLGISYSFLYFLGQGPTKRTKVNGQFGAPRPMLRGVNGDGWYWMESVVLRAKFVDEALFTDLLADLFDR